MPGVQAHSRPQEFVDARKLGSLQNAPQVRYSNREPPLEIRQLPGLKNGEDWGYVTFGERITWILRSDW